MALANTIRKRLYDLFVQTIQDKTAIRTVNVPDSTSPSIDAFGRLRVSTPQELFQSKFLYGIPSASYVTLSIGNGLQTFLPNESSVVLSVGSTDGDRSIVQTQRYFPYNSGKSQLVICTGVLGESKANKFARLGLFDDYNGIFFESNEETNVVIRSYTTGSVVEDKASQANWNLDTLDGSGDINNPSGILLDISKAMIFIFDFQWLGVGKVRCGFVIGDNTIYVHEFTHSNIISKVYMSSPVLPLRYEIVNIGETSGPSELKAICASVASEGGQTLAGLSYSAGNSITAPRSTSTTSSPIFAIRMKELVGTKINRKYAQILAMSMLCSSANTKFIVKHIHSPSSVTATWNTTDDLSGVEYSTDISAITAPVVHDIHTELVSSSAPNPNSTSSQARTINEHSFISRNIDNTNSQYFVVYAQAQTGTGTAGVSIDWLESE
jgi:hypothetical protein